MTDSPEENLFSLDEVWARLEMGIELLRWEWRDGCPAGMAYMTALGSMRRNLVAASAAGMATELATVISLLERYPLLPLDQRRAALTEIVAKLKRLTPELTPLDAPGSPVSPVGTVDHEVEFERGPPAPQYLDAPVATESPSLTIAALFAQSPSDFERTVARLLTTEGFGAVGPTAVPS